MKSKILHLNIFLLILISATINAQTSKIPQFITFQAEARDASGNLIPTGLIQLRLTIKDIDTNGTVVYCETQQVRTNQYGSFTAVVHDSANVSNSPDNPNWTNCSGANFFDKINWSSGKKWLKIEYQPSPGPYIYLGYQLITSTPFSFASENTEKIQGTFVSSTSPSNGNVLKYSTSTKMWEPQADDNTTYSAGNGINVSSNIITNTSPDQTISITGIGQTNVLGAYPNFVLNTPNYAAGIGVDISGSVISINSANITPPGSISAYGGFSSPMGWLLCDGSAVSRTTYANLYAAIQTNFGSGDGSTTFNLPDFRGRFLRGRDAGAGNDPDNASRTAMNAGGNIGNLVGSVQADELKSHSHGIPVNSNSNTGNGGWLSSGSLTQTNSTNATGGNETRPVNAYVNYIIKY